MTLTAPEHLKGKLSKYTPQSLRDERNKWCADMKAAGFNDADVGAALGISVDSAYSASVAGGWRSIRGKRIYLDKIGVAYGVKMDGAAYLSDDQQHQIVDICANTGLRICEVMSALTSLSMHGKTTKEIIKEVKNARKSDSLLWR